MSKQTVKHERHRKKATRTHLQTTIKKLKAELVQNTTRRKKLEMQILGMPNGISQLRHFVKLNQLENREKALVKRLEGANFQLSCLETYRVPSRDPEDTFDEWKVAENEMKALEAEKALSKIRENRMNKENDKEMDR